MQTIGCLLYTSKIEQICRDKKGEELSDFYELVKYTNNIEKLYLMRYLDADDFYCENLLKDMRIFTNHYKICLLYTSRCV